MSLTEKETSTKNELCSPRTPNYFTNLMGSSRRKTSEYVTSERVLESNESLLST